MNLQYDDRNDGWPLTQNVYPGEKVPGSYGTGAPYETNQPYGMNQPYGQGTLGMPYGMNQPYVQSMPNMSYGMNQPYGQSMPNMPYGMNQPYGQGMPSMPYGMNQPYVQSMPGMSYGANLPCPVSTPHGSAASRDLPAVYAAGPGMIEPYRSPYQLAPHSKERSEKEMGRLFLFSMAGIIILAFLAIMIGITVNDDGSGTDVTEAFASWVGGLFEEHEEESLPVIDFTTQSSGTVRGEMCAVSEDGSIFVRTEYGICRIGKNGNHYEYNGWAASLPPEISVKCMAVYGDYLYLACGENGIYRVNTARSNTLSQIIDDYVGSFAIAEDNLFYLSMDYQLDLGNAASFEECQINRYGSYGELYIAGLNGKGSRSLGENVSYASAKYQSSADFVYLDGYLYFFDDEGNLKRIRTDGTGSRVVVERERQKASFRCYGLYENGGVLYLPSLPYSGAEYSGLYSYDVEADKLKKVSDACVSMSASILFAGDALLYKEYWGSVWHQIKDGQDTVLESPFNDTGIWMQAVGENELIVLYEPQGGYYSVLYVNGGIRLETPVGMDYTVMPEVDMEEEQSGLLQGTVAGSCRAAHLVFAGPNEDSVYEHYVVYPIIRAHSVYGNIINNGLAWNYTDGTGEHTERLVEGEVGTFLVEADDLFYTLWDEDTESYAFYYECLDDHSPEEMEGCLIASGMQKEFTWCHGMIYYVSAEDQRLYRYVLWNRESEQVSEDEVGCYDIDNGMIYYENLSEDSAIYKMRLDGTEAERIDTPLDDGEAICQLTVCPYLGEIYLAVTLDKNGQMSLFAVDGSMELFFGEDNEAFDGKQTIYYCDGLLYYSANIGFEVRVFDFEEYFDGGNGIREGSYDTTFCEENMNTFAVTDEFVYVQMYSETSSIKVFDRQTGELVEEIDCLES